MKKSMRFSNAFGKFMFYLGNIIIGIIFVSPLIWMISASLKPEAKIFANMDSLTTFLPVQASLNNYAEVFSRLNMPLVFKNTLLYIALILVLDRLVEVIRVHQPAAWALRSHFSPTRIDFSHQNLRDRLTAHHTGIARAHNAHRALLRLVRAQIDRATARE